jgi:prepilin-type N-terminal cleavage/methylation domain-containing protein
MTKINKKGLSLVELMMVIAIGGVILTTAGVQ